MSKCHYCETNSGLRPYGPGGAPICFPCMKASPEREQAAMGAFGALLDAADGMSEIGAVRIGDHQGPQPLTKDELNDLVPGGEGA